MQASRVRRGAGGAAAVLAVALIIGACSGGPDDDGGDAAAGSFATVAESGQALRSGTATGGGPTVAADTSAATATAPLPAGVDGTRIVKTASIDVEVEAGGFDKAFSRVATIAATHGGFVASSASSRGSGDDDRQAAGNLVVRVPAEAFDAARRDLIDLGDLRSQQLRGDDVGGQVADLEARLRNLRSQEEALRLLMTKTTNVGETIEVQRQLSGVREQIEQLSAQLARLNDAVSYATLTFSLAEPGAAARTEGGSPIAAAFGRALDGAEAVVGAVIVALGYLLPLALLLALGWLVARPMLRVRRVEP